MVITNASHPKALWPGVKRWWGVEYKKHTPVWSQIFEVLQSTQAYEEDVETTGFGLLSTKNQGSALVYDTAHQGIVSRYTHISYALGYIVTAEELSDNLYEKVSFKRSTRLARSVYETEEIIHANVLNRGFTSGFTGGDGVVLFSASHPCMNGSQSNLLTAADLSEAALEDAVIAIGGATDSRGIKVNLSPRRLIVPNESRFEADRLLKSEYRPGTADNDINALKSSGFPMTPLVSVYLTDTDAWFVQTDAIEGLTHYTSWKATFDKDNDFDTKNLKASVVTRFSCGWTDFRSIWGAAGG